MDTPARRAAHNAPGPAGGISNICGEGAAMPVEIYLL